MVFYARLGEGAIKGRLALAASCLLLLLASWAIVEHARLKADTPLGWRKVLIATNGMAATEPILPMRRRARIELGDERAIQFVAMATPEDLKANAEFVRPADSIVEEPGGDDPDKYVNVDVIVKIAQEQKVDAVWPGWGHASDNPSLPDTLDKLGIKLIGPIDPKISEQAPRPIAVPPDQLMAVEILDETGALAPGGAAGGADRVSTLPIVVALDQSIAAKVLDENVLASGAVAELARDQAHHPIVFAPDESINVKEMSTKYPSAAATAASYHYATKYHAHVVLSDQSIAAKVLDKKAPDGSGNDSARARPHLVVVLAPDQLQAVKILDENVRSGPVAGRASTQANPIVIALDRSIKAEELDSRALGGAIAPDKSIATKVLGEKSSSGRLVAAIDDGKLDQNARTRKTDLMHSGADHTVQVSHESSASRALLDTDAIKRSLQVVTPPNTTTCTLIAEYNRNETANGICKITDTLRSLLPNGEKEVSATDVAVCFKRGNCRRRDGRRRLMSGSESHATHPQATEDNHASFNDTERSLQSIAAPSPTSTLAPGYIVFTVIATNFNCTEIAANLKSRINGLLDVYVDLEGTIEVEQVSPKLFFAVLARILRHLHQLLFVHEIFYLFYCPTASPSAIFRQTHSRLCSRLTISERMSGEETLLTASSKSGQNSQPNLGGSRWSISALYGASTPRST